MTSDVTQIAQPESEREGLPTNWGRRGEQDERGTLNPITAEVRTGRTVSLARALPTTP